MRGKAGEQTAGGSTDDERVPGRRRPASAKEAKALAHPLRLRILRLCAEHALTNKELADRLGKDPGTVLYHVRQLVGAGLLEPSGVRTGESGALEKPYRSTGGTWWLEAPFATTTPEEAFAPVEAFVAEVREVGPSAVRAFERFTLHLSPDDVADLDRRILAVIDQYVLTEHERAGRPAVAGMFVLHAHPGSR
jgi:DNA-binding transcriptional ArsR family regulator